MRNILSLLAASLLTAGAARPALAGPCADQIASLSRTISAHPATAGAPTTGTLNGSGPDAAHATGNAPNTSSQADATSQKGRLNGESGNREMNAAASNTATSPEDVRRQQAGLPTMADSPGTKSPDMRMAKAQQMLDHARALDAQGDPACRDAVAKASELAGAKG